MNKICQLNLNVNSVEYEYHNRIQNISHHTITSNMSKLHEIQGDSIKYQ